MRKKSNEVNRATLRDVATLAGVGESTASRVLRESGSFSTNTRKRVRDAADRLGYVLDPMAGALASATSRIVGVIVPSLGNAVFTDVLRGIDAVLDTTPYQALVGFSEYHPAREERLIASMLSWRPAAIILAGLEHTTRARSLLEDSGTRVVEILDTDGPGIDIVVGFSNRAAGAASADHLFERGYRRIGYIGHDLKSDLRAAKRRVGFCQRLAELGVMLIDEEIIGQPSSVLNGKIALATLLDRQSSLDAAYFSNDDMAVGGYFHCLSTGIDVPADLALLGHNGLDMGQATPKPLSTVLTPRTRIGEVSAELVIAGAASQQVTLPFQIRGGGTT